MECNKTVLRGNFIAKKKKKKRRRRKTSNRQPNFTPKTTGKEEQRNPQTSRRK